MSQKSVSEQIEEQSQIQEIIQTILIDQEQIGQLRTKHKQASQAEHCIEKLREDEKIWSCGSGGFFLQTTVKEMREILSNEKEVCKVEQKELAKHVEESQKLLHSLDPYDSYKLQQQYLQ
ncbi:hypothetical protein C9374_002145 [Naegleria lovaniensis]|uniref:Prefoldin subunit 1 n=1 Tax=Naegleria lovaniensis TaxID=51637 RepID=A0AA88GQM6_NAELO|nr:uncharacterized protein C9374_002145 [Naegleria lovaniensis]KAG2387110.1 hypothetical protein C9374_002145 [Naegleria lovaniensis]